MPRTSVVLAVLAVVVLAGCSSFGGVATTREPFDVDEPTRTTTETPADRPPVIAFDPMADTAPGAFDLVEAHYRQLAGFSYTAAYEHVERDANGTVYTSDRWTTTFGPNRSTYVQDRRSTLGNRSVHRQLYSNGSAVWQWQRLDDSDDPTVRLVRSPEGAPVPPTEVSVRAAPGILQAGLAATNVTEVTALDTVPSSVDEPVFRVVANETATPNPFGDRTLDVSLTLFVTEEGRIVEYTLERTFVEDGRQRRAVTRVQFRGVGRVTVDRPDWVPANGSDATATTERATSSARPDHLTVTSLTHPTPHVTAARAARSFHPSPVPNASPA
ncbi:hypothetical protein [Halorubellus sp. PRR65]|uniref:hypothetical protein n=1 Tax=Halorubellus sp. PRR65 TaxID=3098148 RepID=UPI002B256A6E|nr:hypothetical protein [Halorubellus sp. PRR65]